MLQDSLLTLREGEQEPSQPSTAVPRKAGQREQEKVSVGTDGLRSQRL